MEPAVTQSQFLYLLYYIVSCPEDGGSGFLRNLVTKHRACLATAIVRACLATVIVTGNVACNDKIPEMLHVPIATYVHLNLQNSNEASA